LSPSYIVQDRRQHDVQWNKDAVQQVNFKKIGTYRPRLGYLNEYNFTNPSTTSSMFTGATTQTNLSLPDLDTIPQEDSIISVESGEISLHVPNVGDVHSSVGITQDMDPHNAKIKSASMDGLLDDRNSKITTSTLHSDRFDESNVQMNVRDSCTSKDELLSDKAFQAASPSRSSDDTNMQINGFMHHTLIHEDQGSNEGKNSKHLSVNLNNSQDSSFLTLSVI